jgi:hypothetical protein
MEDKKWNQAGAKNLAMKFVPTEWTLITDADHFVSDDILLKMLNFNPSSKTIYFLGRVRDGQPCHPHPNSFLLRRDDFFYVDGYDEDFCENYGFEDIFFVEKAARSLTIATQSGITLVNDQKLCTPDAIRNHRKNKHLREKKLKELSRGRYMPPRMVRFNWEIVSINPPLIS